MELTLIGYATEYTGEWFPVWTEGEYPEEYLTYDPDETDGKLCPCSFGGLWIPTVGA